MKTKGHLLMLIFCCILSSCDKDDDVSSSEHDFYRGILTSASADDLKGIWAIFNAEFQGERVEIPISFQECGRDFIIFSENNVYTEYLYQQSDCHYVLNSLNWTLNKGIIKLSNQFGQSDELVITKLNASELVFKSRLDVNDDGILDVVSLYLKPYTPKEIDVITPTFGRNKDTAFEQLLSFNWLSYNGFNDFERYEIYRSAGDNCNISNAELIASISDVRTTEFTDLTPPAEANLCYFLKVFTNRGLLGQSYAYTIRTENIRPQPVTLYKPEVLGTAIQFNWQASTDPYFSHYELTFSNYANSTGYGQQEYSVAIIDDPEITAFLDENPPYLENPYYMLYAYNIFGNRTSYYNPEVTWYHEVPFKRPEVLNVSQIQSYAIDPENPIVYFYGREGNAWNTLNIRRFNYKTNQTEATSNLAPSFHTSLPIQYIDSGYGGEIIAEQGSNLAVYDATTLKYKYTLDLNSHRIEDFSYSPLGYWIIVSSDRVYTYIRDNANLDLIDSMPHFPNRQNSYKYHTFALKNNKILVGHYNESTSYLYELTSNGSLVHEQIVSIPILHNWDYTSQYNAAGNYVINFSKNRLYSTTDFRLIESFESPYFPSGTSKNGNLIFGSNNDPKWSIDQESIHAKEVVIYDRLTQKASTVSTTGYPHIIFENAFSEIISISSGLKKENIRQNINDKADLFLEIIKLP